MEAKSLEVKGKGDLYSHSSALDDFESQLVESGEKERLKELLRTRLVECGWRDDLKHFCVEYIKSKGSEKVTVPDLMKAAVSQAEETVPQSVKNEMIEHIKKFCEAAQE